MTKIHPPDRPDESPFEWVSSLKGRKPLMTRATGSKRYLVRKTDDDDDANSAVNEERT